MNKISLPYIPRQNKLSYLAPLMDQPWSILLDSAGEDNNYNRFDIFCFAPTIKLSFQDNLVQLTPGSQVEILDVTADLMQPLVCMRALLKQLMPNQKAEEYLPFNGGWLGYISYDFARQLETLPSIARDDIKIPQLQMGLYQWAMITDHQTQQTNLHNFGLDQSNWQHIISQFDQLAKQPSTNQLEPFHLITNWKSNINQKQYFEAFGKIQDYIHAGDCYQVNFAQRFDAEFKGDPYLAYQMLSSANQSPFSAYLNFPDHQILSLSPERFIESHQGKVKTQPIKGTRPRSTDPEQDQLNAEELKNSEKDRAENLMIVDLLRNDLSRTAAKASVRVSELFGHYKFASVHHLISTVESQLDDSFDNFDLLATTLPGGSITGAPKIRAMEIIEELELVRRSIYCGCITYLDFEGNMDSNICIRTLVAKNNQLYCWAGGGLVADSKADSEYQETFDKLAKILPVLNFNDLKIENQ